jgi:hypothetical protein
LDEWNFGSLAIEMAEIIRNQKDLEVCENQKYRFQAIVIDFLACTEAKQYCSNRSVIWVLYRLGDQGGGCREDILVDAFNVQ